MRERSQSRAVPTSPVVVSVTGKITCLVISHKTILRKLQNLQTGRSSRMPSMPKTVEVIWEQQNACHANIASVFLSSFRNSEVIVAVKQNLLDSILISKYAVPAHRGKDDRSIHSDGKNIKNDFSVQFSHSQNFSSTRAQAVIRKHLQESRIPSSFTR